MDDEGSHYRRQVPLARTESERLELKREDSGFAFELNHPPTPRSRIKHFEIGRIGAWTE
jgi:hypothetical protein